MFALTGATQCWMVLAAIVAATCAGALIIFALRPTSEEKDHHHGR